MMVKRMKIMIFSYQAIPSITLLVPATCFSDRCLSLANSGSAIATKALCNRCRTYRRSQLGQEKCQTAFCAKSSCFRTWCCGSCRGAVADSVKKPGVSWSNGNGQRDDDQQNSLELDNCVDISSEMFSNCEVTRSGMEVWQIKQQAKTAKF